MFFIGGSWAATKNVDALVDICTENKEFDEAIDSYQQILDAR